MEYADKCTTMRRCVLLHEDGNGNLEWEGVDIEGKIVLKNPHYDSVVVTTKKEIENSLVWDGWFIVYQDEDNFWCPREDCYRKKNMQLTPKKWKVVDFAYDASWWYIQCLSIREVNLFNYLKENRKTIFRKPLAMF